MINLLPTSEQKEIRAARSNTLLLRYTILTAGVLVFLLGALGVTYFSLTQAAKQADATKESNEQRAIGYAETQSQANQLRSDLTSAKTLFDGEIRYSKVITRLSNLLPEGSAVDNIQLDEQSFSQPVTMSVQVRDQSAAESLRNNFTNSPYFTNVLLGAISTNGADSSYPYTVQLLFTYDRSIGQ